MIVEYNDQMLSRGRHSKLVVIPDDGDIYEFTGSTDNFVRVVSDRYTKQGKWSYTTYQLEVRNARVVELEQAFEPPHLYAESPEDLAQKLEVTPERALKFAKAFLPRTCARWAHNVWPEDINAEGLLPDGRVKYHVPKWDMYVTKDGHGRYVPIE